MWPDRVGVLHGPVPGKPASADPLGRRQNPGVERGAGGLGRKGRGGRSCSSPQASGEALDPPPAVTAARKRTSGRPPLTVPRGA